MKLYHLDFPDDLLYAPAHNLWLREDADEILTLGLTAYGCALYGRIFAFTPKREGRHIERDRSFGIVEFAKAASSARLPFSGTVVANNERLLRQPDLITQDCYGEGWMIRLRADDWAVERSQFLSGEAALSAFMQQMELDGFDPDDPGVQALRIPFE